MQIPYTITTLESGEEFISAFPLSGAKPISIPSDHIHFNQIKELLVSGSDDEDLLVELFDVKKGIEQKFNNDLEIRGEDFYYRGSLIHNKVCDLILEYIGNNYKFDHLVKFLGKLMENPSKRSVDLAWEYISRYKMPITENGNFLSMKAVRNDFMDKYSGTIYNGVGEVVEMPRNQISDEPNEACSHGVHVGYYDYVKSYGSGNDQIILVEVNPRDIVCVPNDCSMQKMRVCKYTVIKELGTHNDFFGSQNVKPFQSSSYEGVKSEYGLEDYEEACDNCGEFVHVCECDECDCGAIVDDGMLCDECGECEDCCDCPPF